MDGASNSVLRLLAPAPPVPGATTEDSAAMDKKTDGKRRLSRRDFLKGLPLGIAGALAVGALLPKVIRRGRRIELPPDSIFTPADGSDAT